MSDDPTAAPAVPVTVTVTVTPAHTQTQTIRVVEWYPDHAPRAGDPHYAAFHAAHNRLKAAGKLVCWRCGTREDIQLHHSTVEQALINGVDLTRFEELYPEFALVHGDEAAFLAWCESEGNLLPLCRNCHIGREAIHLIPYPLWLAGRFFRTDLPRPGQLASAGVTP